MGKIIAIIEKSEDGGYGIYAPDFKGLFGYGETEEEAKESLCDAIESQIEYYEENGKDVPEALQGNTEFEYHYDISAFFKAFPFINTSAFARAIGINPSLMRKYKERIAFAGDKQKAIIQEGLNAIVKKLSTVQFKNRAFN